MLLWSYSKVESPDEMFLEKLKACVVGMKQPKFDNFDLTLIVQACKVFEGSYLAEQKDFMSSTMAMLSHLESFVIREVTKMNIHEFMTVATYYLVRNVGSTKLVNTFKNQIVKHIDEFDRIQLALLRSSLKANTSEDHAFLIQTIEDKIKEINEAEEDDVDEEQLRQVIRVSLRV